MAVIPLQPVPELRERHEDVFERFARLVRLELELGVAETRQLIRSAVTAIVVAALAVVTLIAALVVLITGALAPLFAARWEHLVACGGGLFVVAAMALAWCVTRLRRLPWPRETLTSFEETWRWLGAQLRSRLTLQ